MRSSGWTPTTSTKLKELYPGLNAAMFATRCSSSEEEGVEADRVFILRTPA